MEGFSSLIIQAPPLALREMDSFCRLSIPWFFSSFQLDEGLPPFYPPILRDIPFGLSQAHTSLPTLPLIRGHTHPLFSGLHDPDDIALPQQMIRWPEESVQFLGCLLPPVSNEIQFHLGYLPTARLSISKDSKPSPPRILCTMPILHTGFQPIALMLSMTSRKSIYQFWPTQTP